MAYGISLPAATRRLLGLFFFFLDVFLTCTAQASLPFLFTATTALLGVFLTVCKIVISHIRYIFYSTLFSPLGANGCFFLIFQPMAATASVVKGLRILKKQ